MVFILYVTMNGRKCLFKLSQTKIIILQNILKYSRAYTVKNTQEVFFFFLDFKGIF